MISLSKICSTYLSIIKTAQWSKGPVETQKTGEFVRS